MPRKRATGAARPYPYRQKRKDGTYVERWKVELSLGKGADGKYRTKQITASTFRECQRKLKEARERLNRTGAVDEPDAVLVGDYVDLFLESARRRVAPKTMGNYRSCAKRIREAFDGVRVADVRASMVRAFLEREAMESAYRENAARIVLGQTLDLAVADDVIAANPVSSVRRVRRDDVESKRRAFSVPEMQLMLLRASRMPLPVGARMWWRMLTGMRQGEIVGVVMDELHVDAPYPFYTLRWSMSPVRKLHGCGKLEDGSWSCGRRYGAWCPEAVWDVPDGFRMRPLQGNLCLKAPKSRRSRVVPLVPQLVEVVSRYLEHTRNWPNPYGLLWRHEDGSPITMKEDTVDFKRLLVTCGMDPEERTGHETRYSAVTLLRRAGVDSKTVMEIVGHTSLAVDDIYRTVDMEERAEAMGEMTAALNLPKGLLLPGTDS